MFNLFGGVIASAEVGASCSKPPVAFAKSVALEQSVSAGGEKVSKLCLRQVTFVPPTEFTFGPLVTFVGCDGGR
ncbi:MAG: hypothetical protein ACTS5A_03605 [Candidatus Hodgkinia cicadicola]